MTTSGRIIWKVVVAMYCAFMIGTGLFVLYMQAKTSTYNDTYVQFYPSPLQGAGPYIGTCLQKPEGWYCAQVRR